MGKRIAILFDEDIYCQRGMFNAIRNRIKHLKDIADFGIDVYVIGRYEPWHIRMLRHTPKLERVKYVELDGIKYNALWYNFSLIDYILEARFHKSPIFTRLFYLCLARKLHGYDLISAHSTNCGLVASRINKRDGIPFCVTWHGSDIHTSPFVNSAERAKVERILNDASCNFFVSDRLRSIGQTIAPHMNHALLYNGRNKMFVRFPEKERKSIRAKYGVSEGVKVVAFVGNLLGVKNPQLLAPIFSAVNRQYDNKLAFWVIGSGKLQEDVKKDCVKQGVPCVFWGGQPIEKMPEFMNCIDVLVLPSRNEGLPLVVIEAIACGANVVGSDVGGIAEAIGKDNVFPHGKDFINEISTRVVYMLNHHVAQKLDSVFEWEVTAQKELTIYNKLINNSMAE